MVQAKYADTRMEQSRLDSATALYLRCAGYTMDAVDLELFRHTPCSFTNTELRDSLERRTRILQYAYVKNNRTGEEVRWKTQGAFISQQDKAAFQAECTRKQQERAKELLLEHEKTAERVAGQLSWMKQDVPTPYLDRKGLAPRRGVFFGHRWKNDLHPCC